jgi:hypothetical protein
MTARAPRRGGQEPLLLVEADRLDVAAALLRQLTTPHRLLPRS